MTSYSFLQHSLLCHSLISLRDKAKNAYTSQILQSKIIICDITVYLTTLKASFHEHGHGMEYALFY